MVQFLTNESSFGQDLEHSSGIGLWKLGRISYSLSQPRNGLGAGTRQGDAGISQALPERTSTAVSAHRRESLRSGPAHAYNPLRRLSARGDTEGVLQMAWTKPEFTVVAVTLEVTAYAGKR
jgi:coenzyme PQQ precursor peptide PqqA